MSSLEVSVVAGDPGPVIVLTGEADRSSVTRLNEVLTAQVSARTRYLTIDATHLRSIDQITAQALMLAALIVLAQGGRAVLVNPQEPVLEVLNRGRVTEMFAVQDQAPAETAAEGSMDGGFSERAMSMAGHEEEPDWIIALRRRPGSSGRPPDGGTSTFEIICRLCGDDPGPDHRRAPPERRPIRGSYTLTAGIAAFLDHQEFHDRAEDTETGQAGARVLVSPATIRAQVMLTNGELTATRRQAIARARERGLLGGQEQVTRSED